MMINFDCQECRFIDSCCLVKLATLKQDRILHEGDVLFNNGDANKKLAKVRTGMVFEVNDLNPHSQDIVNVFYPGDVIDSSRNNHVKLSNYYIAFDTTSVCTMAHDHLFDSSIDANSFKKLYETLHNQTNRVDSMYLKIKPSKRVAQFILDCYYNLNRKNEIFNPFSLPLTQRQFANYLGLSAETVCRELKKMSQQKLISVYKNEYTVIDIQRLGQYIWE